MSLGCKEWIMIKYTYTLVFTLCISTMNFCMEEKNRIIEKDNVTWTKGIEVGKVQIAGLTGYAKKVKDYTVCYILDNQSNKFRTYVSSADGFIDINEHQVHSEAGYNELLMIYKRQLEQLPSKNTQGLAKKRSIAIFMSKL